MIDRANIEKQTQAVLARLQTIRDEIRLRLHLGEMDLQETWRKISPLIDACARRGEYAKTEAIKRLHALTRSWDTMWGRLPVQ